MMQAVVIAPTREEGDFLSYILRQTGLTVGVSFDLTRLLTHLPHRPVDLIVIAGEQVTELSLSIKQIREVVQIPILVLVEAPKVVEHCALLDAGADLVITAPSPHLLSRYARMFLHRAGTLPMSVLSEIHNAGITLDPVSRRVFVDGTPKQLTQLEFRLLYVLMSSPGQIIPIDSIVERVWGYSGEGDRKLVRGLVSRLRRKIEPDVEQPKHILNHPGIGYSFSPTIS